MQLQPTAGLSAVLIFRDPTASESPLEWLKLKLRYTVEIVFLFQKSSVYTTSQANQILNAAWNNSVDRVVKYANDHEILGDLQVKQNTSNYIKSYLSSYHPSASLNPTDCAGNIPINKPAYCVTPQWVKKKLENS